MSLLPAEDVPPFGPFGFSARPGGYTFNPQVLTLDYVSGRGAGGLAVTITGLQFRLNADGSSPTVLFGAHAATSVVVVDASTITCVTPARATSGLVDVSVTIDGTTATLPNAFTYLVASIQQVTPNSCKATGGKKVTIYGYNFEAGASILFGATPAVDVVFFDDRTYVCTAPAVSFAGPYDVSVVASETATARNGFLYTLAVLEGDVRRQPSVATMSTLDNPKTCQFTIGSNASPPDIGEEVTFVDQDANIFTGNATEVASTFEAGKPSSRVHSVGATDRTWLFNSKRPFGTYDNERVDAIVKDLVAKYAPGFTTTFVQTHLARISIVFDGNLNMIQAMNVLVTALGEGHWYVEGWDLHLYHVPKLNVSLNDAVVPAVGNADALGMVVVESGTDAAGYSLPPGYYQFFTTSFYKVNTLGGDKTYSAVPGSFSPAAPPVAYVQLSDQAQQLNLTGQYSNGTYADEGTLTFYSRGWVMYDAAGGMYSAPPAVLTAGDVTFASADVATSLEGAVKDQGNQESRLSQSSNIVFLSGNFLPQFDSIPIAPALSGLLCWKRRIYFIRFGDLHVQSGTTLQGYAEVQDNVTTGPVTLAPAAGPFELPTHLQGNPPPGPAASCLVTETDVAVGAGYLFADYSARTGWWVFQVANMYADGSESYPSPPSGKVFVHGQRRLRADSVQLGITVNGMAVVARKIYGTFVEVDDYNGDYLCYPLNGQAFGIATTDPVVHYFPSLADCFASRNAGNFYSFTYIKAYGSPAFAADVSPNVDQTSLVAIVPDNTTIDGVIFSPGAQLGGGDATRPVGVPWGADDPTTNVDGPSLESDDIPQVNDAWTYLLKDPPFRVIKDGTQLRNRIFVKGKGTIVTKDATAGDLVINVMDTGMFSARGGQAILGSRIVKYTSLTTSTGTGQLILAVPLEKPILQSSWLFGGGLPIRPFVMVEDVTSQKDRARVELDKDGNPTDGVHEFTIDDNGLATTRQCYARGMSELQLFSRPILRCEFYTRWPAMRAGKVVHVNMTNPSCKGDFIVQTVSMDQYYDEADRNTLKPRYRVMADSAARFDFHDLLLALADKTGDGGVSTAGIADTALAASSDDLNATVASFQSSLTVFKVDLTFLDPTMRSWNGKVYTVIPAIPGKIISLIAVFAYCNVINNAGSAITASDFRYSVSHQACSCSLGTVTSGNGFRNNKNIGTGFNIQSATDLRGEAIEFVGPTNAVAGFQSEDGYHITIWYIVLDPLAAPASNTF